MLCVHYQDASERARAVESIARGCQRLGLRLTFLGPNALVEETRRGLQQIETPPVPAVQFRSLPAHSQGSAPGPGWNQAVEAIRAELLAVSAVGGESVVWVEVPTTPSNGLATPCLA